MNMKTPPEQAPFYSFLILFHTEASQISKYSMCSLFFFFFLTSNNSVQKIALGSVTPCKLPEARAHVWLLNWAAGAAAFIIASQRGWNNAGLW